MHKALLRVSSRIVIDHDEIDQNVVIDHEVLANKSSMK